MPPRKKVPEKIAETPVVFFLKISEKEEQVIPVGQTTSYSEILDNSVKQDTERFSATILRPLLEHIHDEKYSEHTDCFWCCHQFAGFQFKIPVSYNTICLSK